MFNKIPNISHLTLYWQHQAWFLLSSCAFQEEAGAARPGCCGGMPRALLHSHSHAWKLLFPHGAWLVPGSSPLCFSESTAVSGWLQVLRPLSAWHLELSQQLLTHGRMRPLERDVVKFFFLSAARVGSLTLSPFRKHLCLQPGFCVRGTRVALYPKVPFFTLNIAVHQVGSPCPVKVGITWQGSHPGASTAPSTWDCCWNWEGSSMGPCLGTSSRFGVGSWVGLVAFCWRITVFP